MTRPAELPEIGSGQPGDGEGQFASWDETSLFFRWSRPQSVRANVVIVHGAAEHSGRYVWMIEALVSRGFATYGFDHRGLGNSGGKRGDVNSFGDYVKDVEAFLVMLEAAAIGAPLFLIGHSMGALIAAQYAATHARPLSGVVLMAMPARLKSPIARAVLPVFRAVAAISPGLRISAMLDPEHLSSNPDVVEAARTDPLIERRVTVRWMREMLLAIERLPSLLPELKIPVLVLHGGRDPIASIDAAREAMQLIASRDKSIFALHSAQHELHNETREYREEVFALLLDWMDRHM